MNSVQPVTTSSINEQLRTVIKRRHYPLSLQHIEEMMVERGIPVDHATIHRWTIKMLPVLAAVFRAKKSPVGASWVWMRPTFWSLASGNTFIGLLMPRARPLIFLMSARRDAAAARRFLENAMGLHGIPQKISIDGSTANKAAILEIEATAAKPIELRQIKYINNLIEQDHRAIKRIVRPMLGFKSWTCACTLIAGIETMHMIKKGQLDKQGIAASAADQFYSFTF